MLPRMDSPLLAREPHLGAGQQKALGSWSLGRVRLAQSRLRPRHLRWRGALGCVGRCRGGQCEPLSSRERLPKCSHPASAAPTEPPPQPCFSFFFFLLSSFLSPPFLLSFTFFAFILCFLFLFSSFIFFLPVSFYSLSPSFIFVSLFFQSFLLPFLFSFSFSSFLCFCLFAYLFMFHGINLLCLEANITEHYYPTRSQLGAAVPHPFSPPSLPSHILPQSPPELLPRYCARNPGSDGNPSVLGTLNVTGKGPS